MASFIPPSFEPNTPCEPQWFPRPITDSIESSLDLLERLEEDRKRRLRSIANVAARTPIGLGGVEDRGHAGSASNHSPKPAGGAAGNNNFSRYRYYPPTSSASEAASLHTSYQRSERGCLETTPPSVTTRRGDRHYRRGTRPHNNHHQHSHNNNSVDSSTMMNGRDGARTPVDGIGTASPAVNDRAYVDDSRDTSYRRDNNNSSFRSNSSSMAFMSPPLDPRAGGGAMTGRRPPERGIRGIHYQRQSPEEISAYNIDTAATPTAGAEEYVTPPAMSTADQTPGHGFSEDVYSQRRATGQRRRRGWDEMNV